jgi:hypothetical protein
MVERIIAVLLEAHCGSLLLKLSGIGSREFMLQPAKGQTPVQLIPLKQFTATKEQLIPARTQAMLIQVSIHKAMACACR